MARARWLPDGDDGVRVSAKGVWASYGAGGPPVLRGVDLHARAGLLTVIVGPNGSGKSTLLRAVAGLLPLTEGTVKLGGDDLSTLDRGEVARRIGLVPQAHEVALGFTVREVVMMGRAPHQGGWLREAAADRERVAEALARCELEGVADRPVAELSGGEQRRVALARALAQDAPILLLDEPGAHLDVRAIVAAFERIVEETRQNQIACVAVVHDLNITSMYADHVVLLREGRVVAAGDAREMMTADRLGEVFGAKLVAGDDPHTGARYFLPDRR